MVHRGSFMLCLHYTIVSLITLKIWSGRLEVQFFDKTSPIFRKPSTYFPLWKKKKRKENFKTQTLHVESFAQHRPILPLRREKVRVRGRGGGQSRKREVGNRTPDFGVEIGRYDV